MNPNDAAPDQREIRTYLMREAEAAIDALTAAARRHAGTDLPLSGLDLDSTGMVPDGEAQRHLVDKVRDRALQTMRVQLGLARTYPRIEMRLQTHLDGAIVDFLGHPSEIHRELLAHHLVSAAWPWVHQVLRHKLATVDRRDRYQAYST